MDFGEADFMTKFLAAASVSVEDANALINAKCCSLLLAAASLSVANAFVSVQLPPIPA
jgi:hypothetical protein